MRVISFFTLLAFSVLSQAQSFEPLYDQHAFIKARFEPMSSEQLVSKPTINDIKLSPSGDWLIAVGRYDGKTAVSVITSHPAEVVQIIGLKNFFQIDIDWLTDEYFAVSAITRGVSGRATSIFKVSASGDVEQVVAFMQGSFVHISPADNEFVFQRLDRPGLYSVYQLSAEQFSFEAIEDATAIIRRERSLLPPLFDPISKRVMFMRGTSVENVTFKAISTVDGSVASARVNLNSEVTILPLAMLSPSQWIVITDEETPRRAVQYFNPVESSFGEILYQSTEHDVISARLESDGKISAVTYLDQGSLVTKYIDDGEQLLYDRISAAYPDTSFSQISQTEDREHILLLGTGSLLEPSFFMFHGENDSLQLLQSQYSAIDTHNLSPTTVMSATSSDGERIEGFLTMPLHGEPLGLIVKPHGGPIGVSDNRLFNAEVQYFASRGFAVLRTNFRGSEGYGRAFREQGRGELGQLIEDDIMATVNAVQSVHNFDKVCAMGGSYGAYSSMMLSIRHPELFDCAIGSFGIYDLPLALSLSNRHLSESTQERIRAIMGDHDTATLMGNSPVYLAEDINVPVMLIAGAKDAITPPEHTHRLEAMLSLQGNQPEGVIYNNARHGHSSLRDRRHDFALRYDFLLRSMGIQPPLPEELYATARSTLADDYLMLGRLTLDEDLTAFGAQADPAMTSYYFERAAELGSLRAKYELGKRLLDAEDEHHDTEGGLRLLEEAAEYDQWQAQVELGKHYLRGNFVDQDFERAQQLIEDGFRQYDEERRQKLLLAEFYCVAPPPYQDLARCAGELKRRGTDNRYVTMDFRKTVGRIYEQLNADDDAMRVVRERLVEHIGVSAERGQIDEVAAGLATLDYGRDFGTSRKFNVYSSPDSFSLSENLGKYMGLTVRPEVSIMDHDVKTGMVLIWRFPDQNGNRRSTATLFWGSDAEYKLQHELTTAQGIGDYEIEVLNLHGEVLYQYRYEITP